MSAPQWPPPQMDGHSDAALSSGSGAAGANPTAGAPMQWDAGPGAAAGVQWDAGPGAVFTQDSAQYAVADPEKAAEELDQSYGYPKPAAGFENATGYPGAAYPATVTAGYPGVAGYDAGARRAGCCGGRISRCACLCIIIAAVIVGMLAVGGTVAGVVISLADNTTPSPPPRRFGSPPPRPMAARPPPPTFDDPLPPPPDASPPSPASRPAPRAPKPTPSTSSTDTYESCVAELADAGALFASNSTNYVISGYCFEADAYGACLVQGTNKALKPYCSAACRADVAQVSSGCKSALTKESAYLADILYACEGTDGLADCDGAETAPTPTSQLASSDKDALFECIAKLSLDGALFNLTSTNGLSFDGSCRYENAYGTCYDDSNQPSFNFCSSDCRAEVEQVPASCQQLLPSIYYELADMVIACTTGSQTVEDCNTDSTSTPRDPLQLLSI